MAPVDLVQLDVTYDRAARARDRPPDQAGRFGRAAGAIGVELGVVERPAKDRSGPLQELRLVRDPGGEALVVRGAKGSSRTAAVAARHESSSAAVGSPTP